MQQETFRRILQIVRNLDSMKPYRAQMRGKHPYIQQEMQGIYIFPLCTKHREGDKKWHLQKNKL